jgi:hypothetical protein
VVKFLKNPQKGIDKSNKVCYNKNTKGKVRTKRMSNAKKIEILMENRKLIEIYSKIKELTMGEDNETVKTALELIDRATDLLSEV